MNNELGLVLVLIGSAGLCLLWKIWAVVENIDHSLDQSKRLDALERLNALAQLKQEMDALDLDDDGEEWKR